MAETLRDAGHAVVVNAGGGSFKSQMKKADASGARFALIIGDDEAAAGTVAVKPLRDGGEQVAVPARDARRALARDWRMNDFNDTQGQDEHGSLRSRRTGTAGRPQGVVGALGQHRGHGARHRVRSAAAGVQGWRWWTGQQGGGSRGAVHRRGAGGARQRRRQGEGRDGAARRTSSRAPATRRAPRSSSRRCCSTPATPRRARAQLQWVVDHADEQELKEIARYRLAELLLNDKQYDEALKMLDAKHGEPFAGLYADLRGDALAAAGRTADARAAYQDALAKFDAKSPYRNYVQVKLDALGGARRRRPPRRRAAAAPAQPRRRAGSARAAPAKQ